MSWSRFFLTNSAISDLYFWTSSRALWRRISFCFEPGFLTFSALFSSSTSLFNFWDSFSANSRFELSVESSEELRKSRLVLLFRHSKILNYNLRDLSLSNSFRCFSCDFSSLDKVSVFSCWSFLYFAAFSCEVWSCFCKRLTSSCKTRQRARKNRSRPSAGTRPSIWEWIKNKCLKAVAILNYQL